MGNVTAKVALTSKERTGDQVKLSFHADYADGRNKAWAVATPSLQLAMTVKPEVSDLFELNGRYTLTFSKDDQD